MHTDVKTALQKEASLANLAVDLPNVEKRIDEYIRQYFADQPQQARIIETYLANAAIQVAILTKRASIGIGDAEGAIFAFCLPTAIDRTCRTAGQSCLEHFDREFLIKEAKVAAARVEVRDSFRDLLLNEARSRGGRK